MTGLCSPICSMCIVTGLYQSQHSLCATAARLLDWTTRASHRSPRAPVSLDYPWPCLSGLPWFLPQATVDEC